MRRLLVVAIAAAMPALALAQTQPQPGVLQGLNNNLIGSAQCGGTQGLRVLWAMKPMPTAGSVGGFGTVKIFASNKKRTGTTEDPRTCWRSNDNFAGDTTIKTAEMPPFEDRQLTVGDETILPPDVAKMMSDLGINCATETTSTPVYMCALAYTSTNTTNHIGYANGDFTLNNRKPNPPTNVGVEPAENALRVRWTEATTGENATEFRVIAKNTVVDTDVHTARTNGSPAMVNGLVNGTLYSVTVIAISLAGSESDPSQAVTGTPQPTEDFWDWYQGRGGVEQGGCTSGAAGALALLGAAALLRVRRRKP
jgi:MYXO-CTERM domain-containing protein